MIPVIKYPNKNQWTQLTQRPLLDNSSIERSVGAILQEVRNNGDKALKKYSLLFDKVALKELPVSRQETKNAARKLSSELKRAIQIAKKNIEKFHSAQKERPQVIETAKGVFCWRKQVPIEKVGLYIPGGSAPLFSTLLMLGVPAKIAGCPEIVLCSPSVHPAILYTAQLLGIKNIFRIGGAQAIAAMAYGTASVPKVNKIFGPGNQYVTCAKQLVQQQGTVIDMPAGPSEIAIIADETCIPAFVASDLLAQAEHGPDSQVMLITTSKKVIAEVTQEIKKQIKKLPRRHIAEKALSNSKAVLVKTQREAIDLLNEYAPEHASIVCKNADSIAEKIVNAGSVFIGSYSPVCAGDYCSGTNHTLPTNGYAKSYSGVSLDSFLKKITFQKIAKQGLKNIGKATALMAETEGLDAHKNSITIRTDHV